MKQQPQQAPAKGTQRPKKKREGPLAKVEALRRVEAITLSLWNEMRPAIRVEAALEVGNDWVHAHQPPPSYAGHCYSTIHESLTRDLALRVARFFDIGRRHPNHQDKASIPVLVHLLRQKRVRDELAARARGCGGLLPAEQHARDALRTAEEACIAYGRLRRSPRTRKALDALKDVRDGYIAHRLSSAEPVRVRYEEVFHLLAAALAIIESAHIALKGSAIALDAAKAEARRQAEAFWHPALEASMPATRA